MFTLSSFKLLQKKMDLSCKMYSNNKGSLLYCVSQVVALKVNYIGKDTVAVQCTVRSWKYCFIYLFIV